MSREVLPETDGAGPTVEIVRSAFAAFDRGDIEGVLRLADEDIVITQPPELPGVSPEQHGHRARTRGRGNQSGVEVAMEFSFVFTVRDAKISEWRLFVQEDQALEAAGLSE